MKSIYPALIIFICAAIFRLTFLDLIEFKLDEARDVYEMVNFYRQPHLFQLGPIQSTGVYNPPLWYYFLTIISLPSRDPQYLSFMMGLLNSLAVAAFYLVVRKFYGQKVGVAAGLLLAFSPWAILFSRKIWAPDLIFPLMVPLFYILHKLFLDKTYTAVYKMNFFWISLLLSLLAQLHASGLFLAVVSIIVITIITVIQKIKVSWKGAGLGLLISLIPLLPYLAYQIQTGCADCQAFFSYQSEERQFDTNNFLRPFQLINGSSYHLVLGDDYEIFLAQFPVIKFFNMLFLLEFTLGILGIIYILRAQREDTSKNIIVSKVGSLPPKAGSNNNLFLLIYLGVVPLLYFISKTPAHLYYFLILAPVSILLYALGIAYLGRVSKNLWIPTFVGMTVVVINIIFEISFYQFLSEKQNIQGDYGPVYRLTRQKASSDDELIRAETYLRLFME